VEQETKIVCFWGGSFWWF